MIAAAALAGTPVFARLRQAIEERTGLYFGADRAEDLAERLSRRFAELKVDDPAVYLELLARPGEAAALARLITTGETSFLRHADQVAALGTQVLPGLVAAAGAARRLRLWSAGCASGEEAYTLAILLVDGGLIGPGWDVRILASDLNPEALARTREGRYRDWSFRTVPPEWRNRHFARVGDAWEILPRYRALVEVRAHNLAASPFAGPGDGPFDLILCRNVLIYFSAATAAGVVAGFLGELRPGGWLGLGPAESSAELCRGFVAAPGAGGTLWRRPEAGVTAAELMRARNAPTPPSDAVRPPAAAARPGAAPATRARTPAAGLAERPRAPRADTPGRGLPGAGALLAANAAEERWRRQVDGGDWPAALAVCAERLAAHPGDGLWHLRQGLVSDAAGDAAGAERSLRRALYLDRGNALAHHQLGLLCARAGRETEAARCWRNARAVIAGADDRLPIAGGDGMTAGDLRRLVALAMAPIGAPGAGAPVAGDEVAR